MKIGNFSLEKVAILDLSQIKTLLMTSEVK